MVATRAIAVPQAHLSRVPFMLIHSVVNMLGLINMEPNRWLPIVLFTAVFALCSILAIPYPIKSISWNKQLFRLVLYIAPICSTLYVLTLLQRPAPAGIMSLAFFPHWVRLAELLQEGPDSSFHVPGAAGLRVVYVLWYLDVSTLQVLPQRASLLRFVITALLYISGSHLLATQLLVPTLPMVVQIYGMLGAFALNILGADVLYQVTVCLIWGGQIGIKPSMLDPWRSASLREFWGKRYNLVVGGILSTYVYKPLRPYLDMSLASFATFIASGLLHIWPLFVLGSPFSSHAMVMSYFTLHGLFVGAEAKGLIPSNWALTMTLLLVTWPLFGIPLLRVVSQ